jgi:hypothetical protein
MATMTIKGTYSLDVETVRRLEAMARRWKVSKSEALRRAIRAASEQDLPEGGEAIEALDQLQESLGLDDGAARRWENDTRTERRESSRRGEDRSQ